MERTWWRLAAAGALLAVAAVRLNTGLPQPPDAQLLCPLGLNVSTYVERGESLLHGIACSQVSWDMPFDSVSEAWLCQHAPAGWPVLARLAARNLCLILVFGLGCLLHGELCGGLAALLFAWAAPDIFGDRRWLYTVFLLLVACLTVWRAGAPSWRRSLLLAAALGMSLLVLSPLFLFPFVLAGYELARRGRERASWKELAALGLGPFLLLAPWVWMNWRFHHRLVLFEDGRAEANVLTGALGFVFTVGGGVARHLADIPAGQSAAAWAAGQVLAHPLRFMAACLARLAYAVSLHPLLWLAALGAAWRGRKLEPHRQLALLVAYFLGVHCLLSVQQVYFRPVLPLLAAAAAAFAASWLRPSSPAGRDAGIWPACVVLAPLLILQTAVLGLVAAYPGRAAEPVPQRLASELARRNRDPWLWYRSAMEQLRQGQADAAAAALGKAMAVSSNPVLKLPAAWARLLRLGPAEGEAVLRDLDCGTADQWAPMQMCVFNALWYLRWDRQQEARDALGLARGISGRVAMSHAGGSTLERRPLREADFADARIRDLIAALAAYWPQPMGGALAEKARRLLGEKPAAPESLTALWAKWIFVEPRSWRRAAALAALGLEGASDPSPAQAHGLSRLYAGLDPAGRAALLRSWSEFRGLEAGWLLDLAEAARGAGKEDAAQAARGLAEGLLRLGPPDISTQLSRAAEAGRSGRREEALAAVDSVGKLELDAGQARQAAQVLRQLGDDRRALELLAWLARRIPRHADLLLDWADSEQRGGRRAAALEALQAAASADLDAPRALRAAALYGGLNEPGRARDCLRRLLTRHLQDIRPRDIREPGALLDLADAAAEAGQAGLARRCVEAARGFELRAEQLGQAAVVYQQLREYPRALEVLDRLVRERPAEARWRNDRGVLKLLMGRREEAARDLEQALAVDPRFLPACLSLGALYASAGRRDDAKRLYRQALRQPAAGGAQSGLRQRVGEELKALERR